MAVDPVAFDAAAADPAEIPEGRFLVIGCGSIGRRHLGNLQRLGVHDLVAFDDREDRRRDVTSQFAVQAVDRLDAALAQGIRAALICTPTHLHVPHALEAAGAGCPLFIEKPLADSLEAADALVGEADRRGLTVLVGCNYRFEPGLRHVKSLLDAGQIGRVVSARASFGQYLPDWHPWEDYRHGYSARRAWGGGVLLDRIHEFDYLRWLLGEAVEVYSMWGHLSRLETDAEDTSEVLLRFSGGAFGSIHLDCVRRAYDSRLEIVGEDGIIEWSYQDRRVRWYLAADGGWFAAEWPERDDNTMYVEELRHFLRVVQGLDAPLVEAREGRRVLATVLAARRAGEERRAIRL